MEYRVAHEFCDNAPNRRYRNAVQNAILDNLPYKKVFLLYVTFIESSVTLLQTSKFL